MRHAALATRQAGSTARSRVPNPWSRPSFSAISLLVQIATSALSRLRFGLPADEFRGARLRKPAPPRREGHRSFEHIGKFGKSLSPHGSRKLIGVSPPICAARRRRRTEPRRPQKAGRPPQAAPHRPPRAWPSGSPMLPATTKMLADEARAAVRAAKAASRAAQEAQAAAQYVLEGLEAASSTEPAAEPVGAEKPACARQ